MKKKICNKETILRLKKSLIKLKLVEHNKKIANWLKNKVEFFEFDSNDKIIKQNDDKDTCVYFIISGKVAVEINRRIIATRVPGDHVGEMAAIDSFRKRSATIVATESTVCAIISENNFIILANKFSSVWRTLTLEMAERLRERSKYIKKPNYVPNVFIGTSKESLSIGKEIKQLLDSKYNIIRIWDKDIFGASDTAIESLILMVQKHDFGIIILNDDDILKSRGKKYFAPRDNVIFELGLLIGALGRERVMILHPLNKKIKIPTDLLGINLINFEKKNLPLTCEEVRKKIRRMKTK